MTVTLIDKVGLMFISGNNFTRRVKFTESKFMRTIVLVYMLV